MKKEIIRREIKPKPDSKGKRRPGVDSYTKYSAETDGEMLEVLMKVSGNPSSPEEILRNIIDLAEAFIPYELMEPDFETERSINKKRLTFEAARDIEKLRLTPEFYAIQAHREAIRAIKQLEMANVSDAMHAAMYATMYFQKMLYVSNWEPSVATFRDMKVTRDKMEWAQELANHLIESYPEKKFPAMWNLIPSDSESAFCIDGFSVFREDDELIAEHPDINVKPLGKESFRTGYFQPAKKLKTSL